MVAISLSRRVSLCTHADTLCFAGVNQAGSDIDVTNSRLSVSFVIAVGVILHGPVQILSYPDMVKLEVWRTSRHAQHRRNTAIYETHKLACDIDDRQVGLAFNIAYSNKMRTKLDNSFTSEVSIPALVDSHLLGSNALCFVFGTAPDNLQVPAHRGVA